MRFPLFFLRSLLARGGLGAIGHGLCYGLLAGSLRVGESSDEGLVMREAAVEIRVMQTCVMEVIDRSRPQPEPLVTAERAPLKVRDRFLDLLRLVSVLRVVVPS